MMNDTNIDNAADISLKDLVNRLWAAKLFVAVGIVFAVAVGFVFLTFSVPKYKASMIIAPADGYALGDYASSVQYDRMAALPFWRPKDQEGASTDFYRFIHTLRGTASSEILMKDENVLRGINATLSRDIKTPEELAVYLSRHLRVDPLGASPLRRLNYHHPNAEFAAALLRKIHLVADQMIRRDRRRQSQSRIEYLENALRKTVNPDHRKGITNLLMQQEHVQMLANLDEAYAAIVVEPASSSPKPVWPSTPLTLFIAVFIGMVLGYVAYCLNRKPEDASLPDEG